MFGVVLGRYITKGRPAAKDQFVKAVVHIRQEPIQVAQVNVGDHPIVGSVKLMLNTRFMLVP